MTRAYNETYLNDFMGNLGDMFDYAVNDCHYDGDIFFERFIASGISRAIEQGHPRFLAGLSGPELASAVVYNTEGVYLTVAPSVVFDRSPEYWAGWILAYYQWYTARSFADIYPYPSNM